MKVAIVDLNSRTPRYDLTLTNALFDNNKDMVLMTPDRSENYNCPVIHLFRIYKKPQTKVNKFIKAVDVVINYFLVLYYCRKCKIDIVHFQWLPLIEYCSFPLYILKWLSKRAKIVLTVHNIYPHRVDIDRVSPKALSYKKRFVALDRYVDSYIVHTMSSKNELSDIFNIQMSKIYVCYHGLFSSGKSIVKVPESSKDKFSILMFGIQSFYKGTDLLIAAIGLMPKEVLSKIKVTIAGISTDYRNTDWFTKAELMGIEWVDRLLGNCELDNMIAQSNLLVFPYRSISQSGALLQALSFDVPILTSNLPPFLETLDGLDDSAFFESGNIKELEEKLLAFIDGKVDIGKQLRVIKDLQKRYSWETSAKQTMIVYNSL